MDPLLKPPTQVAGTKIANSEMIVFSDRGRSASHSTPLLVPATVQKYNI